MSKSYLGVSYLPSSARPVREFPGDAILPCRFRATFREVPSATHLATDWQRCPPARLHGGVICGVHVIFMNLTPNLFF